ncbi:expressed unknown protein [Seminavis robusta]|uniref:Uncharacterized protein n=1 Tax=Seminavis robusta TaxID=568900 RepID=A0A9N8HJJ8_9STRA|nr:expressed unknown protein [Seminavis robusta]|eukprot:Sro667_g184130.1 n/a (423) ;mRNA; f:16006-17274
MVSVLSARRKRKHSTKEQPQPSSSYRVCVLGILALLALCLVLFNAGTVKDIVVTKSPRRASNIHEAPIMRKNGPVASCVWSPESEGDCSNAFSKLILYPASNTTDGPLIDVPRRWLFFGDSTMWRLFAYSGVLARYFVKEPARDIPKACPSQFQCKRHQHKRCELAELFQLQPANHWIPPNASLGEGPIEFGAKNPFCQDCSGCNSVYATCKFNSTNITTNCDTSRMIYGGYFSIEFARDVELQSTQFQTTQENVAQFMQNHFNGPISLQTSFGGKPICVVSAGIHDMAIANMSASNFVGIVDWYLELLQQQCDSIVWLQNAAPQRHSGTDPFAKFAKQHWVSVEEWNRAVHQHFNDTTALDNSRILVMDVFEASKEWPFDTEDDNIHKSTDWYRKLATFFKEMAQKTVSIPDTLPQSQAVR